MHTIEDSVSRGICIGCGACSAATAGAVQVRLTPYRVYGAVLDGASESERRTASRVCPFSDESPNEDDLSVPRPHDAMSRDPLLGVYSRTFAGRVSDETYVQGSSSGGLTSWICSQLLEDGHADAVIHVGSSTERSDEIFKFTTSGSTQLSDRRKSIYYATTMSDVLKTVGEGSGRYVLVGVPCFIRAARALCRESADFGDRIVFFVALVCGHLKSQAYAESLAWQLGVHPSDLLSVDFRVKSSDRPANDYGFSARSTATGASVQARMSTLRGGNWGHGALQAEACDFCDDVVGETADVSLGDAWLPEFVESPLGTNIVITRNQVIDELFDAGERTAAVTVFELSPQRIVASQAGGFRHRREGLAVRLADDIAAGLSVPAKRVTPALANSVGKRRVALYRQRRKMSAASHHAYRLAVEADDIAVYLEAYKRHSRQYRRLEAPLALRMMRAARVGVRRAVDGLTMKARRMTPSAPAGGASGSKELDE